VLIAAITSCTNTSNPAVLVAAGLLARNARKHGLAEAVGQDQPRPGLARGHRLPQKAGTCSTDLESVGFYLVGYGCTTCIGNSGPLRPEISDA
jgi:aconitate hydratase